MFADLKLMMICMFVGDSHVRGLLSNTFLHRWDGLSLLHAHYWTSESAIQRPRETMRCEAF